MDRYEIIVKTLAGLEEVLMKEISELGGTNIKKLKRAVSFMGTDEHMINANLKLRTALSVLIPITEFKIYSEDDLYKAVYDMPWETIFGLKQTFAIKATVSGTLFTHSKYVALKTKDAIADRFRAKFGKRPYVDTYDADYQLVVHIQQSECSISLDSTGVSLDKRGYRLNANEAPINEVLAAGIIQMANWNLETDIYDLMSGSGTFGIEAAMLASKTPPGFRRSYAFQKWTDYDAVSFHSIKKQALDAIVTPKGKFYCSDIVTKNLSIIEENAQRAAIKEYLNIQKQDYFDTKVLGDDGIIFLNPPYGERMQQEEIGDFYKEIGDVLKNNFKNCEAWVVSSNMAAMKRFGLKAASRTQVFNGGLECKLNHYKLY